VKNRSTGPIPAPTGAPRPGRGGGDPPSGLVSPKVGLAGLVFGFAALAAAYLGLGLFGDDPAPTGPEGPPPRLPPAENVDDDAVLTSLAPEDARRRIENELGDWFGALGVGALADDQAVDEAVWVEHLLQPALWQRIRRLPERIYPPLATVPVTFEDPTVSRGRLVRVWGRVSSVREVALDIEGGPRAAWVMELTDQNGAHWTTTGLDRPDDAIEAGVWVKAYGVFTKLWPGGDGGAPALHAFLTRRVLRSFRPVAHLSPQLDWINAVHDDDAADPRSADLESIPFYGMLNYVRNLGQAGYRQARDTERLQVFDCTDARGALPLKQSPRNYRFTAVRLRVASSFRTFGTEFVNQENPGNIDFVYRGYVQDDQGNIINVISPFPADAFAFRDARLVILEGFFFKRQFVEAGNGRKYWMPVILATDIRPIDWESSETDPSLIAAVILGGSALVLFLFIVLVFRGRQERRGLRDRHTERRAKKDGK